MAYSRPVTLTAFGNAQIDTAQSKFGGSSLLLDGTGDYVRITGGDTGLDGLGTFTIEGWFRFQDKGAGGEYVFNYSDGAFQTGEFFLLFDGPGGSGYEEKFRLFYNGAYSYGSNSFSYNTWYHIAFVKNGSSLKVYVDGTEEISGTSAVSLASGKRFEVGFTSSQMQGHVDELRASDIARYTSSFTAPTAAFENDADTIWLYHFDGADGSTTFTDDDTTAGVTHEGEADLSAAFAQTAAALRIKSLSADLGSLFTPSITINASRAGEIDLYAAFSQPTVDVSRTRTTSATPNTAFTQTVDAEVIKQADAALESAFTQADVDAIAIKDFDSSLSASFTQADVESGRIRQGEADLGALFSPSIFAVASLNGSIDAAAQVTFSADADRTRSTSVTLENIVNLSLQSDRIRPGASTLESASTITIAVDKFAGFEFDAAISFAQSATALRIKPLDADLGALFTPNIVAVASLNGSTDLLSSATLSATATRIQPGAASFESAATLSSNSGLLIELDIPEVYASSAALSASPISYTITAHPFDRPNDINAYKVVSGNWGTLDNTILEYNTDDNFDGSYAASFTGSSTGALAVVLDTPISIGSNEDFFLTFHVMLNDDNSYTTFNSSVLFSFGDGFNSYGSPETNVGGIIDIGFDVQPNDEDIYLFARFQTGSSTWQTISTTYDLSGTVPRTISLRRSGSTISLITDNTVRGTKNHSGNLHGSGDTFVLYAPEGITADSDPSFDRFYFRIGDSGPANPISPLALVNDERTVFYHSFEQTREDTYGIIKSFGSTPNAVASLTADGIIEIGGAADLNSAFSQTTTIGTLESAGSNLSATVTVSADVGVVKTTTATLSGEFTQTASATVTRTFDTSLVSAFTLSATAARTRPFGADFEAFYTQLSAVSKIGDFFVNADVVATQTVDARVITDVEIDLNATFSQTASFGVFRRTAISLTTVAAQNANINVIADADSALNAEFTKTLVLDVFRNFASALNSEFSLSADTGEITQGASLQLGEFGISVTAEATKPFDAALTSAFSQTADAIKAVEGEFDANSAFSQTAQGSALRTATTAFESIATQVTAVARTASFILEPDVVFSISVVAQVIPEGASDLNSEFAVSIAADRTRETELSVASEFDQTVSATKAVEAAALVSTSAALTAEARRIRGLIATPPSEFAVSAQVTAIRTAQIEVLAVAQQSVAAGKIVQFASDLGGLFTPTITAGVNLAGDVDLSVAFSLSATARTLRVDRIVYTVPRETRTFAIESETRSYSIHKETRTYTIEEEN